MRKAAVLIGSLALAANWAAACQVATSDGSIPARFSFDGLTPAAIGIVSDRLGASLTATDLRLIESAARRELDIAFENTRLRFVSSGDAVYRVRVIPHIQRTSYPAAGQSRYFAGVRGDGAVSFNTVALSALGYATAASDRQALVEAIGRGVGRTAVHEFAHQILGPAEMDGTKDPLSYEHADLRAEHFYGSLHWGPAAARLQEKIGVRRDVDGAP